MKLVDQYMTGIPDRMNPISALEVINWMNEELLVCSNYHGHVQIWNGLHCVKNFVYCSILRMINLNGDQLLVSGHSDGSIQICDNQEHLKILRGHKGYITDFVSINWWGTPLLASAGFDKTIRLWNILSLSENNNECVKILTGHTETITVLAVISWNGMDILVSGSMDSNICIWDTRWYPISSTKSSKCMKILGHSAPIESFAVLSFPWAQLLVSGDWNGSIHIWDIFSEDGKECMKILKGHEQGINTLSVIFCAERQLLVSSSHDMTICIWDPASVRDCRCLKIFRDFAGYAGNLTMIKWRGRESIVIGHHNGIIHIWDITTNWTSSNHHKFLLKERKLIFFMLLAHKHDDHSLLSKIPEEILFDIFSYFRCLDI